MGKRKLVNPIPKEEWNLLQPIDYTTMYEFGNKKNSKGVYKYYFESIGIKHVSIDLNGQNNSLPLDLAQSIKLPSKDIVTNIGTIEHIYDQASAFQNAHYLSHYKILHIMPYDTSNNFVKHGYYHYKEVFFKNLAELNNYKILKLGIYGRLPRINIFCLYDVRDKNQFIWNNNLPITYNSQGRGGTKYVYFNYD